MIRWCEMGGREDTMAYNRMYGGELFHDKTRHPFIGRMAITRWGRTSTAAGAYQLLEDTYNQAVAAGICYDFTDQSQDKIAVWLIRDAGALQDVRNGRIDAAIRKVKHLWPSLPGGTQSGRRPLSQAWTMFEHYQEGGS